MLNYLSEKVVSPLEIICDFDGTVTPVDTTDELLSRFAPAQWEEVEKQWVSGLISARECMFRQIGMLQANKNVLDCFLDNLPIDRGFAAFVAFSQKMRLKLTIVSDGLDYVIKRIMLRYGLSDIPVIANCLSCDGDRYELSFPYSREGCGSGVCKCATVENGKNRVVLIGDGRSDICLADKAYLILAKRGLPLEKYCHENSLNYLSYDDFHEIIGLLSSHIEAIKYKSGAEKFAPVTGGCK